MLSLYIHIPFCDFKCGYCSFTVVSTQDKPAIEKLIDPYVLTVCQEIRDRSAKLGKQTEIKSIYIGGGTPTRIGKQNLHRIIDTIIDTFNTELLAELTIECNPFPQEEVLDIITSTQNRYTSFPRVRRSIGIQTFDGEILKESSRMYSFPAISQFLRDLQVIKQQHTLYNLDFIAFGKRQTNKKGEKNLRHSNQREFFLNLVESHMADSFSVYTLELFPGSTWYNDQIPTNSHHKQGLSLQKYGTDDEVYDEFLLLRSTLQDADYHRYEISNFCLPAKSSIHNRVYRNMEDYIGIGVSAASFIDLHHNPDRAHLWPDQQQVRALRRTNTKEILAYIQGSKRVHELVPLSMTDYQIEQFFLNLRTDMGVQDSPALIDILVADYKSKLAVLQEQGYIQYNNHTFILTDQGLDVYNTIVTDLLQEI